jgi:hypothetical protein
VEGADRVQPGKFFLGFLSVSDPEEIRDHITTLSKDSIALEESLVEICFHMKGGVTWEEAWAMAPKHREMIVNYVSENYKKEREAITGRKEL